MKCKCLVASWSQLNCAVSVLSELVATVEIFSKVGWTVPSIFKSPPVQGV
jgi:hypothetical protein